MLHTFPDASEIVTAVREWLLEEVVPAPDANLSFHARVAANLLGMLERELQDGPGADERFAAGLAELGAEDEAALATMLRDGVLAADSAVLELLRETTTARLRVSNPRHLVEVVDDDPRRFVPNMTGEQD